MKIYNIKPTIKKFSWGEIPVIELGQNSTGRRYTIVPVEVDEIEKNELAQIGLSRTGKPKIIQSNSNLNWLAVVSSEGCYTRGTHGTAYVQETQKDSIKIIESGYGAYGAAGRVGEFWEFLLEIPDGTFLKIRPSGGEYKIPSFWLYFGTDKVNNINKEELDIFCERFNLESPEGEKLIDLSDLVN